MQLTQQLKDLDLNTNHLNQVVEQLDIESLANQQQNQLINLNLRIKETIALINPQVNNLKALITEIIGIITQFNDAIARHQATILPLFPVPIQRLLNDIKEAEDMETQSNNRINYVREQERQNQHLIDQDEQAQAYLQNYRLLQQIVSIKSLQERAFQLTEIMCQQINLITREPQSNLYFPDITKALFWSHVYRKVSRPLPSSTGSRINFERSITFNYEDFDIPRKRPGTNDNKYRMPSLDKLHSSIYDNYSERVVQTRRAANDLTDFKHFDQLQIDDIPGLELVYADVQRIYNSEFLNTDFETIVNNYNNAKSYPVKQASEMQLSIPPSLQDRDGQLICHMVSVLFEKTTNEFFALDITEYKKLKQNKDLSGIKSGSYSLYKRPIGLSENEGIVGIDPGVRDIVCAIDCPQNELKNKNTVNGHAISISNKSYKVRSGMEWIRNRELQNRNTSNIQGSHDRLETRKICSNEGGVQRALAKKCIIIPVEFPIGKRSINQMDSMDILQKRKRILYGTSTCPDRMLSEQGRTIYPLKLCPQCLVNNNNPLYWNRDVNAAANIRTILVNYIISGFYMIQDLHSYPEDEKIILKPRKASLAVKHSALHLFQKKKKKNKHNKAYRVKCVIIIWTVKIPYQNNNY
ncbi:MAG: hypothetical protein EXX96DRAFT_539293 [Benjaminiella poitrasii]|nr:MAG: hypothetical protein EXX96DRAFT_539293 [Benjaminiella poitrasii]